jgi:hypothetical protein
MGAAFAGCRSVHLGVAGRSTGRRGTIAILDLTPVQLPILFQRAISATRFDRTLTPIVPSDGTFGGGTSGVLYGWIVKTLIASFGLIGTGVAVTLGSGPFQCLKIVRVIAKDPESTRAYHDEQGRQHTSISECFLVHVMNS